MNQTAAMQAQAVFYQQYEIERRDEVVGILLAVFLGSFGAHHFYLKRTGLGVLYLMFFWTGLPGLMGLAECFFMPRRVRQYNAMEAAMLAARLGIGVPIWQQAVVPVSVNCPRCQSANPGEATFCGSCGQALRQ